MLDEAFYCLVVGRDPWLPLGALMRLVEFPVKLEHQGAVAQGHLRSPGRPFRLDTLARSLVVEGQALPYPEAGIQVLQGELYVALPLLEAWMPLGLEFDARSLSLNLNPTRPLPIQERWARESRPVAIRTDEASRWEGFRRMDTPYLPWSLPAIDFSHAAQFHPNPKPGTHFLTQNAQAYLTSDLAWMTGEAILSAAAPGGLLDQRFTLRRRDPTARLLGPLQATEVALGDIAIQELGVATHSVQGKGVYVSGFPLSAAGPVPRRTFDGLLPPGWQVELYQNGAVVGFQRDQGDGRYEFRDIMLMFGVNEFRLVFYGPLGERREERLRMDLREPPLAEGAFQWRMASVSPRREGQRTGLDTRYGLAPRWVLAGALVESQLPPTLSGAGDGTSHRHTYLQPGLRYYGDRVLGRLQTAWDTSNGGRLVDLGLDTGLEGGHSLSASHTQLWGFISEAFPVSRGRVLSRDQVQLAGPLPDQTRPKLYYQVQWTLDTHSEGGHTQTALARLGFGHRDQQGVLNLYRTQTQGYPASSTQGTFIYSGIRWGTRFRGISGFTVGGGGLQVTSLGVTAELSEWRGFQRQVSLSRSLGGMKTLTASLARHKGAFALGLDASITSWSGWSLSAFFRVGLTPLADGRHWSASATSAASQGTVAARAFEDLNSNGLRDPEEPWLEATDFTIDGNAGRRLVDGRWAKDHLGVDRDQHLTVVPTSLEDPQARPAAPGYTFIPRPGRVVSLEIPIVVMGQINGQLLGMPGMVLQGVTVEAVGLDGQVKGSALCASDGIFSIDDVPPGTYWLRVPPDDLQVRGWALSESPTVRLEQGGAVVEGAEVRVSRRFSLAPRP